MKSILDKINSIEETEVSGWSEDAKWRSENREWLDKSLRIAIRILREIRRQKPINGMSQKALAESIGVTPQYINKVVKGQENLTLSTISKIESVLGISLMEIPVSTKTQAIEVIGTSYVSIDRYKAIQIGSSKIPLTQDSVYNQCKEELLATGTYGF